MKRFALAMLLALGVLLSSAGPVLAAFPDPQGYVNDFANLLTSTSEAGLEARLAKLEKDTQAEVAVVTVLSLEGDTIEGYAVKLFEAWGIGKKAQDNGVLFIMSLADRKVRIEVGYGLEGILTDGRCGRILDDDVLPSFREGDYEGGMMRGALAVESYIRAGAPPAPLEDNPLRTLVGDYTTLLTILGFITIYLMGWMARTKSIWLGGIWGVIVGVILGMTLGGLGYTIGFAVAGGILGALLDWLLSRNYKQRASSGMSTGWFASGGGFRGGGGGSSFGGFSGGRSGGAGASRGW